MSLSGDFEGSLGDAAALGSEYRWLEATDAYERALRSVEAGDFFRMGEIQEKIGYCLHRAAFQAESHEEFQERMKDSIKAYERAHGLYDRLDERQESAWMLRCRAVARYLDYWLAPNQTEKRRLLDESLELEEEALTSFWDQGEKLEYGRTYNDLSLAYQFRVDLEWDREALRGILERAIAWGGKAVKVLSQIGDTYELARAGLGEDGFQVGDSGVKRGYWQVWSRSMHSSTENRAL